MSKEKDCLSCNKEECIMRTVSKVLAGIAILGLLAAFAPSIPSLTPSDTISTISNHAYAAEGDKKWKCSKCGRGPFTCSEKGLDWHANCPNGGYHQWVEVK